MIAIPNRARLRRLLVVASAAAGFALPGGARAQSAPGIDNIDSRRQDVAYTEDALRVFNQVSRRIGEAWRANDAKAVAELYSVGAAVSLGTEGLIRGSGALERALNGRIPSGSDLRFATADFVSYGELMNGTGAFVLELSEGEPVSGTFSMTIRRESGRWRIRSLVLSTGLPLAKAEGED